MTQFNGYTEKEVLADALTAQKAATGALNNFSNECMNDSVRKVMLDILSDEHAIQFDVFNDMHQRGFYPVAPAQQDKICKVKDTYKSMADQSGTQTNTGVWHTKISDNTIPN